MSIKTKFLLATYVFSFGAFFVCAAMRAKPAGLALFLGSIVWYVYVKETTRCPKCGERLAKGVLVPSAPHWQLGIPVDCPHCRFPFNP
jgi:hypothetical protein